MIDAAFLQTLKDRVSLPDLIGRRVRLVKRGREHSGLCPFHTEKSPSFTVNEQKGFYHCFGCGAHGSAVDFVMATENLSFPEAVERLAAEAGLRMPAPDPGAVRAEKKRAGLQEAVEAAASWFAAQLQGGGGTAARAYLDRRGVTPETAARFRLGLAPDSRTALRDALIARDLPEALLVEAGLLIRPEDGSAPYDRFRNRLIFPIGDRRGRPIAFGGRALGEARAKYLNSPETPLFHKGATLYNFANARQAAGEGGRVIVVEGYMDVIALAQAGFPEAVAPLGTALTEEQMQLLWRAAPNPLLCFDGDAAGERAAARALERALPLMTPQRTLGFVALPEGQDPDDLIAAEGRAAMEHLLDHALGSSEMIWRVACAGHPPDTPEDAARRDEAALSMVGRIGDPVLQRSLRDAVWERIRAERAARRSQRGGGRRGSAGAGLPGGRGGLGLPQIPIAAANRARPEARLLALGLAYPELVLRDLEGLAAAEFSDRELDSLKCALIDATSRQAALDAMLDSEALRAHLSAAGHDAVLCRLDEMKIWGPGVSSDAERHDVERDWQEILARLSSRSAARAMPEQVAALRRPAGAGS